MQIRHLTLLFCLLTTCCWLPRLQAQEEEEVFRVVEEMPQYPGCEDKDDDSARLRCRRSLLMAYLEANLEYPAAAKAKGVEGTTVVSFIVNKDGSLSDIKVLRDIGAGCGEAAKAVISKMEADGIRWNPGRQRGIPVRVLFNLPVVFKLPVTGVTRNTVAEEPMVEQEIIEDEIVMDDSPIEKEMVVAPPPPAMLQQAPRTTSEAPPPPPVEEKIIRIPEDALLIEEDEITLTPPQLEAEPDRTAGREARFNTPPPPPPPPPPSSGGEDIFRVVEEMPRFLDESCEALATDTERKSCAQAKMLEYVYSQLEYPALAKEHSVEGTVVVAFVVEKDGRITDARLMRDIGAGCGQEALRIVNSMNENGPNWLPGKQRGRTIRVQFNLPIKFRIDQ